MSDAPASPPPAARRPRLFWLGLVGLLIALSGPVAYVLTLDDPTLRSSGAAAWACILLGNLVAWFAAWRDPRWRVRAAPILTSAFLLVFAYGFLVMSRLPAATAVASADLAPDFTLPDHTGRVVSLAEARAAGPVLLVFYRGFW